MKQTPSFTVPSASYTWGRRHHQRPALQIAPRRRILPCLVRPTPPVPQTASRQSPLSSPPPHIVAALLFTPVLRFSIDYASTTTSTSIVQSFQIGSLRFYASLLLPLSIQIQAKEEVIEVLVGWLMMMGMEETLWGHLPLLVRATTKESVEYILEALWRTRKTGLDSSERHVIQDMLHLQNDSDLDPLLVCLRILMRRCVYENTSKDDIPKLFPSEVLPELQKLLSLLLHKFQREWQEDVLRDQNIVPRLKAMTWNMANTDKEATDPAAVINLKLQSDAQFHSGELDVKFQLATDSLDMMLKAMHCIKDQFSITDEAANGH